MLISQRRDLTASLTALLILFSLIKFSIQQSWKNDKIIKQWQQLPSNLFGESITANNYGNNGPSLPVAISSNAYPASNSPPSSGYSGNNYPTAHQNQSPVNSYPANSYTQSNPSPSKSYPASANGYPSNNLNNYPSTQSNPLPSKSYPAPANIYQVNNYPSNYQQQSNQVSANGYPANSYQITNSNPSPSNAYSANNYPGSSSISVSSNGGYQASNYPGTQSNSVSANGYPSQNYPEIHSSPSSSNPGSNYSPAYQNPPTQSSYSNIPNAVPINLNEYSNNQNFVSSSVSMGSNSMGSNGGVYTVQQPVLSNSGENIIETLISGITYDCRGKPSGHWRDPRYCDIFHACVFGNQRKTYSCPVVGEKTYFDETSRRCEFANTNPQGCSTNSYFH